MNRILGITFIFLAFIGSSAEAFDWGVEAYITTIEPTFAPKYINIQIDRAIGSCAAGSWLTWNGSGNNDTERWDNNRAVLGAMLTAQVSRTRVRLYGSNSGCRIEFIHILQN